MYAVDNRAHTIAYGGNLFPGADDNHLVHEAFYDDVAKAVRRRNGVVGRAIANERR